MRDTPRSKTAPARPDRPQLIRRADLSRTKLLAALAILTLPLSFVILLAHGATSPQTGSTPTPSPSANIGDLNGDGSVNIFDLSILLSDWGSNNATADLNKDGTVNVFDLSILLSHWGAQTSSSFISNLITDPSLVFTTPQLAKPGYLQTFTDPDFNTKITRIAGNAGTSFTFSAGGTGVWGSDVRQHYSKDQPWSSDGSLIALQNQSGGTPSVIYLDGNTYQPVRGQCNNYSVGDDRWNPSTLHPHERINVNGSVLNWFDVVTCTETKHINLPFTADNFGQGEGNPSFDGRYAVLSDSSTNTMYVVDMSNNVVGPGFSLNNCGLSDCSTDWVSASPTGKFAVVSFNGDHLVAYDINPTTLAISIHPQASGAAECNGYNPAKGNIWDLGHADMTIENGDDVIIGQLRSWCSSTLNGIPLGQVVKVQINDDSVTSLSNPTNEAQAHHISARNFDFPGWVFVGYYESPGARFSGEVVAVKLDGSKQVMRFAHHHSTESVYRAEVHAVPARDGHRILFASDWAYDCGSGCGVSSNPQAYIIDARP